MNRNDNHNREYLQNLERRKMSRIVDGLGQPVGPANNQPGFHPIPALFWPCYFQSIQTLLASEPELDAQGIVDLAFDVATKALSKIGFKLEGPAEETKQAEGNHEPK